MEGQRVRLYFTTYFRKVCQYSSLWHLILWSSCELWLQHPRDRSCGVRDWDLCLCAPFNPAHEIPSATRAQQVTEPALHSWWEELCPAWSQSRRKALSSQQRELEALEAGESHARFLRFYANCWRLGRSVKISELADTLCICLRSGVFMCIVCVCLSNGN